MPKTDLPDSAVTVAVRSTLRRVLASGVIAERDRDRFFALAFRLIEESRGNAISDEPAPAISPRRRRNRERRVKALIDSSFYESRPIIPRAKYATPTERRLEAAREIVARYDLSAAAGLIPRGWEYRSWNMRQTAQHSIAPLMGKIRRQRGDW